MDAGGEPNDYRNETSTNDERQAQAGIPIYWIVYVTKGMIEVLTDPANGKKWRYRTAKQYGKKDKVPLVLRGKKIADIPVRELV